MEETLYTRDFLNKFSKDSVDVKKEFKELKSIEVNLPFIIQY